MFKPTDAQLKSSLDEHIISRDRDFNNYDSICFEGLTRTESGIAILTDLIEARAEIERQREKLKVCVEFLRTMPHHINCASRYAFDLTKSTGNPCSCYKSKATEVLKQLC